MAGSGLVGRVVSVGPHYAKVISIISDTSSVSATVLATSNNLIVSGSLQSIQSDGTILFSQLSDPDNNVSVGDKVVTSNISDKYLPGILIGYINTLNSDSNNLTKSGLLTPAVDFDHQDEVLVILQKKQDVDTSAASTSASASSSASDSASDSASQESSAGASSSTDVTAADGN